MTNVQIINPGELVIPPGCDDPLGFITKTKRPTIRHKGAALAANAAQVDAFLTEFYGSDTERRELMRPWAEKWAGMVANKDAMVTNSSLLKREWAVLDQIIYEAPRLASSVVTDLAGLTTTTTLAEQLSQWRVSGERMRPNVNMDGRSRVNQDRTDKTVQAVPLPIVRTDYEIGSRELLSSRTLGTPLDTTEAIEAVQSINEEEARIVLNGAANIVVGGDGIPGYTNFAARDTATAAAYGGGDFGTISNIRPTFLGMITALTNVFYRGPFRCYISNTQYIQMLARYTDGSGQTALDSVLELPQIASVATDDLLADGNLLMVQLTRNVVDRRVALVLTTREWQTPDGQSNMFAVMAAAVQRLKSDYRGNTGIAHATAC